MSLRVDMMHPEELRYQGPVSQRFLGVAAGVVVLASLFFWIVSFWFQRGAVNKEVAQLEDEWAVLSPRYEATKAKMAEHGLIQAVEGELKQWNTTRIEWGPLLDELNDMVPNSIQLTRLSFRCEWSIIRTAAPPQDDPDKPAKPAPPGVPARRVNLTLSGRAAGDEGGDAAVRMVPALKNSKSYGAAFETIKLQNLLRDAQPGDAADRTFSIEAIGMLRKLQ